MSSRRLVALLLATVTATAVLTWSSAAWAHVTITPDSAARDGYVTLSFVVPNESTTASTTKIEVTISQAPGLIRSIRVQPKPGWKATLQRSAGLVTGITWEGGSIGPDEFDTFTISAGPLPPVKQKVFKVVQTYSDGTVARWIEEKTKGAPAPEHPAPVLTIKAKAKAGGHQ